MNSVFLFLENEKLKKLFYKVVFGTLSGAALLFCLYAIFIDVSHAEKVRGFIVTIVITPLLAIPFAIYVMNLQYELHKVRHFLEKLVKEDFLTKLYNRRAFYDAIAVQQSGEISEFSMSESQYEGNNGEDLKVRRGALLIIDVDDFKAINDTYGHDVGDKVLVSLADVLRDSVRQNDIVGRIGGEEFAIYLQSTKISDVSMVFNRMRETLRDFELNSALPDLRIRVSSGATVASQGESFQMIYKLADQMLYNAKRAGKDRMFISNDGDVQAFPNVSTCAKVA